MNIYYPIIRIFIEDPEAFTKYNKYINTASLKENHAELYKIYSAVVELQSTRPQLYTVLEAEIQFYVLFPQSKPEVYKPIFSLLRDDGSKSETIIGYLDQARSRSISVELARRCIEFSSGGVSTEDFTSFLDEQRAALDKSIRNSIENDAETPFVTDDLEELYALHIGNTGLRWRLRSLNESLGSLRLGDFGFLFARPEKGKTTFLASEVTFMAGQLKDEDSIIWFNNEEQSRKVQSRCIQAALNMTQMELYKDLNGNKNLYSQVTGNRIKVTRDCNYKKEIERLCELHKPKLIIFDQIDKIEGFQDSDGAYDLKLKAIYKWARDLSKKYGPVIGVCQAGGTGDGKKWLTMNDVDRSHTAKQGEADWMLGIGHTYEDGYENQRYMSLSKNKLEGDADTNPERRHDKWTCRIVPTKARYEDF